MAAVCVLVASAAGCFFVVWLIYDFELGSLDGLPFAVPVPTYLRSWQSVLGHVERGHQAFFWGDLSGEGWWYYFPVAFLIKTPLVTLLLLVLAAGVVIVRRDLWRTAVFLLIPVAALFGAAIVSHLNIGYRHILPSLPFFLVLAGHGRYLLASLACHPNSAFARPGLVCDKRFATKSTLPGLFQRDCGWNIPGA